MPLNCNVGEDSWESLGLLEIQPVRLKGNQSWIFIGRTDAEAETPILWPPDAKNWLIRKDSDAGQDWRQEEKGMTKDEMVGWHHRLNGHEFEQASGVGDGQGAWVAAIHRVTKSWTQLSELNWTEKLLIQFYKLCNWNENPSSYWRMELKNELHKHINTIASK